jgi:hypothetical protein
VLGVHAEHGGLEVIFERSTVESGCSGTARCVSSAAASVVTSCIASNRDLARRRPCGSPVFLREARHREPLAHDGDSGSQLERVVLANGRSVIVKHISAAWDWIMRATHDAGREAALWDSGVLQELPPSVDYPVLATEREGDGWAIALGDVGAELIGSRRLSRDECRSLLHAADTIHRHFQGRPVAGLSTLADRAFMFSPRWLQRNAKVATGRRSYRALLAALRRPRGQRGRVSRAATGRSSDAADRRVGAQWKHAHPRRLHQQQPRPRQRQGDYHRLGDGDRCSQRR